MNKEFYTAEEVIALLKISRITLYRWIKSGKLPAVKAGGTYRFKKQDIDNHLIGRFTAIDGNALAAPSRSPLDITARDIDQWSSNGNKIAQDVLPELVRRLLEESRETAGITKLHIPSGDAIGQPGWDGVVTSSEKHPYIPVGVSAWEMGVGDPAPKAQKDYKKRTDDTLNLTASESTFVFVSSRTWAGADDWIARKQAGEQEWADVRVIDATDLESWLELCPVTKRWFMKVLGRPQNGLKDIETFWNEWSAETNPPMTRSLVLTGRSKDRQTLVEKLQDTSIQVVSIKANTSYEAAAFFAAAITSLDDDEYGQYASSILVVEDKEAWDFVVASTESLVLMPTFGQLENFSPALARKHTLILPVDKSEPEKGTIELATPKRDDVKQELQEMGLPDKLAREYSNIGRSSIQSLWRKLARVKANRRPQWVEDHAVLAPAMLIGRWDESKDADRQAVSLIAGMDYDSYSKLLQIVANKPDAPIVKVGSKWFVISKSDLWELLSDHLSSETIRSFITTASELLTEKDPAYELPVSERWLASIHGKQRLYSRGLRRNIADTLAYMAAHEESSQVGGMAGASIVAAITTSVYEDAAGDPAGVAWASLSDVIDLLAEADPAQFLRHIEKQLKANPDTLRYLFQDSKENDSFFGPGSPHTGYLGALEVLAWQRDYLMRVSFVLARLHELDIKDGSYANRPLASLKDIYLSWHPQTDATVEERGEVLAEILRRYPGAGWELILALFPENHGFTSGSHKPRWRDWAPDDITVTYADLAKSVRIICDIAIESAGADPDKLLGIIEHIGSLPPEQHTRIAQKLLAVQVEKIPQVSRLKLWEALKSVVYRHRRFSKQSWAMSIEQLNLFELALKHIEPLDDTDKIKSLFKHHVELPGVDDADWERYSLAVAEAQQKAVAELHKNGGVDALIKLSDEVEAPHDLGNAVGKITGLSLSEYDQLFAAFGDGSARERFGRAVAAGRFYPGGWDWARKVISESESLKDPIKLGRFLTILPTNHETWNMVDASSTLAQKEYWSTCGPYPADDSVDYKRLATELINVGNPYGAIQVLSQYVKKKGAEPEKDLVFNAVESFISQDATTAPQLDLTMFRYYTKELMDYLYENTDDSDRTRLAQIEWPLLTIMGSESRPKVLHEELVRDPVFFDEVMQWAFRRHGSKPRKLTKTEERKARLAYELLDSCRKIPGRSSDGIDEDRLIAWLDESIKLLGISGRLEVGEQVIGKMLASSKVDPDDDLWPERAVRRAIEHLESHEVEEGIRVAIYNRRGFTSRGIGEGGSQERGLAKTYKAYENKLGIQYPRTKALLKSISDMWMHEARRHDIDALQDEIES